MPVNFKVGELTQGEVKLLDWVGKKFGASEQFASASSREYSGKITPGSEAFYGMKTRIGKALSEKLTDNAVAMTSVSVGGLPLVMMMGLAGVSAAPMLAVGATITAVGMAGLAVGILSEVIGEKITQKRMEKALKDSAPSQVKSTFSV